MNLKQFEIYEFQTLKNLHILAEQLKFLALSWCRWKQHDVFYRSL